MQTPPYVLALRSLALVLALLIFAPAVAAAANSLSEGQRQQIIRDFLAEHPFVHRALPRGHNGVRIEDGKITPSEAELNQMVAQSGPAAHPGDRVRITAIHFSHHTIVFDINGGPKEHKSWRDHVSIGMSGSIDPSATSSSGNDDLNGKGAAGGSSIVLAYKDSEIPSLNSEKIKNLLEPVLDFKAATVAEAYQKTLPPRLAECVKKHQPLVGMDRDMVTYTMGRPPRRVRETVDGQEYEEWIYGAPPQDVQFIRFLGDKVVRIEEMKVSGEKIVRTKDELGQQGTLNASAQPNRPAAMSAPVGEATEERRTPPTLMRPGERSPSGGSDTQRPASLPPDAPSQPQPDSPN